MSARSAADGPDHGQRLAWLVAAFCLVPALLDGLQAYLQARLVDHAPVSWRAVLWQAGEWLILGTLTPLTYVLGQRFPLRRPHLSRNVLVHVAGALLLCLAWASAGVALGALLSTSYALHRGLLSWLLTSLPWSVFMYFTVLGCMHAVAFFLEARAREVQTSRLMAQLAEARLAALRAQLHPHFLFNSLNAITVLVRDGESKAAARLLGLLSDVLRIALRTDPTVEVRLGDELDFVERYLAIEEVRFPDRLRTTIEVADDLRDAAVPGFVLQPLVENALVHGLARRLEMGRLEVRAARDGDDLVLTVRDDGPGPGTAAPPSGGVGLANTRDRLEVLYPGRGRLDLTEAPGGGTVAIVRLPYRRLSPGAAGA